MYSKKPSLNVPELIENEKNNDLSLTIYYLNPNGLMFCPVSSVEDLINRCERKIVINGSDLKEHIDLFKQISNDVLIPVKRKTRDFDFCVYYVLESKKNGKLFDVVMWEDGDDEHGSIFVNEFEVKTNCVFYDVIIPFLPEDKVNKFEDFKNTY